MLSVLERVHAVNPHVNALVEVFPEQALAAADEADSAIARGESSGALLGVPISTKINVAQRGTATTNGVAAFKDRIALEDAPVIANLRRAGAILFARSNVPAFSWRWFTANDLYGRTLNPRNPSITPGGSSGGAAVAVATGMGPLAHGSDLAGSIRHPAYACGLYGLKPSLGRVPNFDPGAPERPMLSQLLVTQGPLARTIDDLELALSVMEQPDPRDPWQVCAAACQLDTSERVGLYSDAPAAHDRAVIAALESAAGALADSGRAVEKVSPPDMPAIARLYLNVLGEARTGLLPMILAHGDAAVQRVCKPMFELAPQLTLEDYMQALSQRSSIIRKWRHLFTRFPLIIAPVCWKLPFPNDEDQHGSDSVQQILDSMLPSIAANVLGFPALAVPIAQSNSNCWGVQLIADRFQEGRLFRAARVLAERFPPGDPVTPAFLNT